MRTTFLLLIFGVVLTAFDCAKTESAPPTTAPTTMPIPASAPAQLDNPEYKRWEKFKPGTWVAIHMEMAVGGNGFGRETTTTLLSITADKLVLQTQVSRDVYGHKIEKPEQMNVETRIVPAKLAASSEIAQLPWDLRAQAKPGEKPEINTSTEPLEVLSKHIQCHVAKIKMETNEGELASTIWTTDTVPGGMVNRREHVVSDIIADIQLTVVAFGTEPVSTAPAIHVAPTMPAIPGTQFTSLGSMPGKVIDYALSTDRLHSAFLVAENSRVWAIVDGKAQTKFAGTTEGPLVLSPDGNRLAYAVQNNDKRFAVIDDQQSPPYDFVVPFTIHFSPDSKHVAYEASIATKGRYGGLDRKAIMVNDGQPGPMYDWIENDYGSPIFSPDSQHIAYPARKGSKWLVVIDGKEGPAYDEVCASDLAFSPDSKHVAYVIKNANQWAGVVDGQPVPDCPYNVAYSADGKHMAYAAKKANKWYMMLDGKPGPDHDQITKFALSSDGSRVAYAASKDGQCFIVVDGQPGPQYNQAGVLLFSPDGTHLAYMVKDADRWLLVLDGKPVPEISAIDQASLTFSPDGKRLAYQEYLVTDLKSLIVVDGQPGPAHDFIARHSPIFSPDSTHVAYIAQDAKNWFVVCDGQPGPRFDWIDERTLTFSPDGRHLAYNAKRGDHCMVVLDAQEDPAFDTIATHGPTFDAAGTLEYLAAIDGHYYRVKHVPAK